MGIACDVSNATDVETLFAKTVEAYGQVDLLFNNAGIAAPAVPADELEIEAGTG